MQEDPLYREVILEHWKNPQNYGAIKAADIEADGNNPTCGDQIHLTATVKDGRLTDIAFTSEGCAISKASASLFTEEVKGKPLAEIAKLTQKEALDYLGVTITPARHNCALLCYNTLQQAIPTQLHQQ